MKEINYLFRIRSLTWYLGLVCSALIVYGLMLLGKNPGFVEHVFFGHVVLIFGFLSLVQYPKYEDFSIGFIESLVLYYAYIIGSAWSYIVVGSLVLFFFLYLAIKFGQGVDVLIKEEYADTVKKVFFWILYIGLTFMIGYYAISKR